MPCQEGRFAPAGGIRAPPDLEAWRIKNAFDDWLARIVCFAFSVSPQALVSQINRATAEVQKQTSEEEGFAPVLAWVKALVDEVLAREFADPATGLADIEPNTASSGHQLGRYTE